MEVGFGIFIVESYDGGVVLVFIVLLELLVGGLRGSGRFIIVFGLFFDGFFVISWRIGFFFYFYGVIGFVV